MREREKKSKGVTWLAECARAIEVERYGGGGREQNGRTLRLVCVWWGEP